MPRDLLEAWDPQLSRAGAELIGQRAAYLEELSTLAQDAYLELSGGEAERVEREMNAFPAEAGEFREAFDGITAWAKAHVDDAPVDVEAILNAGAPSRTATPSPGAWHSLRWPIAVAAVALLVFSLSQLSFSVTYGGVTYAWGIPDRPAGEGQNGELASDALVERTLALEAKNAELLEFIEAVALRTLQAEEQFEFVAAELFYAQRLEAQSRHRDMRFLAGMPGSAVWPEVRTVLTGR